MISSNELTKVQMINLILHLEPNYKNTESRLYSSSSNKLKKILKSLERNKLNNMKHEEIFKALIDKYGDKQIVVAIEELSELQKELCKALRNKPNLENITEEMADVCIMITQMIILFDIDVNKLFNKIDAKLERTKERLLNNN